MVYNEKLVVSIKAGSRILREFKDVVYLPFGTEYSILIKNLNSESAVVSISVDGEDALAGEQLLIKSNKSHELKGFMSKGNVHHRFKFIEKTDNISSYRGDRIDDGIVRVEYQFEKPKTYPYVWPRVGSDSSDKLAGFDLYRNTYSTSKSVTYSSSILNEDGITVEGTPLDIDYEYTTVGELDPTKHVIVLYLKGNSKKGKVVKPLSVTTKLKCPTCGNSNKSRHRFCSECGTALI
jgi:ribosomal protein L32